MYLLFEGGEGAGKTTLLPKLGRALEELGHQVCLTREPGGTPLGEKLRAIMLDPENAGLIPHESMFLMMLATRTALMRSVIIPALLTGKVVLCDRGLGSSLIYQGLAEEELGAFGPHHQHLLELLCEIAQLGHSPDHVIVLDVDAQIGVERRRSDRAPLSVFDVQEVELQAKRNAWFRRFGSTKRNWHLVNANRDEEAVESDALALVLSLLKPDSVQQ